MQLTHQVTALMTTSVPWQNITGQSKQTSLYYLRSYKQQPSRGRAYGLCPKDSVEGVMNNLTCHSCTIISARPLGSQDNVTLVTFPMHVLYTMFYKGNYEEEQITQLFMQPKRLRSQHSLTECLGAKHKHAAQRFESENPAKTTCIL